MSKPDLFYSCHDGIWTRFYPETPEGEAAWRVMAEADCNGVVAFLSPQLPSILAQLRKAGLVVRRAKPVKPLSSEQLDAMLAALDG
ncbi:hypothetical protein [Mesorhizobium sp.]|uniref:hypothetical protein n=1 Tax=Mesorhizobium sp. TaxID=1871066 RepID=UPI00121FA56E|nr:hypothetical protein [Mesorhizobium sp.]TIX28865.1 MAG: hypothetical protein E5V35_00455 [Mesorhizobium sp.]